MNNKKQLDREEKQLAQLMEAYARDDGEQLWQEYEAAVNAGNTETVSDALDNCLRRQLDRQLEEKKKVRSKFFGAASRIAVCAMLLLVLTAVTLLHADADTDIQIERFLQNACSLSELENRYLIHMRRYPGKEEQDVEAIRQVMAELISRGYTMQQEYVNHPAYDGQGDMGLYSLYRNEQGQTVRLDSRKPITGLVVIRKEEGLYVSQLQCMGYNMVLTEKGNQRRIYWLDDAEGLRYDLYADGLPESEFWNLVYALAQ